MFSYNEFEINAVAYSLLKQYLPERLTVKAQDLCFYETWHNKPAAITGWKNRCVADLVLYDGDLAILVIEVKHSKSVKISPKQINKYKVMYECPVIVIAGMEEAEDILNIVNKHFVSNPITWRSYQEVEEYNQLRYGQFQHMLKNYLNIQGAK